MTRTDQPVWDNEKEEFVWADESDPSIPLMERVIAFCKGRGHVSFAELEKAFPEHFDPTNGADQAIGPGGCDSVFYWQPITREMSAALNDAVKDNRLVMKPAPLLVYLIDGKAFKSKIAKRIRNYKTPRWFPVTFSGGADT